MKQYITNIRLYFAGWFRLREIAYKPNWSPLKFALLLYWWDYGIACIFLGLGVQSISRWAGDRYNHQPWRFLARVLNAIDEGHTFSAGKILWGSQPCRDRFRYSLISLWIILFVGAWLQYG